MSERGKIAVMGDYDSILAFKTIGADIFEVKNVFEINEVLRRLVKEEYAVVFITEQAAVLAEDTLNKLKTRTYPAVIPIPSSQGSNGYGLKGIKRDVEKAIGADILFNKEEK